MYKPHQHCPYSIIRENKVVVNILAITYRCSIASLPLHGSTIVKQLLVLEVQRFTDFLVALTVESFLHLVLIVVDILDDTVTVHVK